MDEKEIGRRALARADQLVLESLILELLGAEILSPQQIQNLLDRALTSLETGENGPVDQLARQYVETLQTMIGSLRKR